MKSNKGITLIVLVITIIVLLVLAGVAIASLTGSNSIVNRAQEAKTKSEESAVNEEARRGEYGTAIETYGAGSSPSGGSGSGDATYWYGLEEPSSSYYIVVATTDDNMTLYFERSNAGGTTAFPITIQNNTIYVGENVFGNITGNTLKLYMVMDPTDESQTATLTKMNSITAEMQAVMNASDANS